MRRYEDSEKQIDDIGKELRVEHVFSSRFMIDNQRVRISGELIHVKTNRNILSFSQAYDREELFEVQNKISKAIVDELGIHFIERGYITAKKREPQNSEAYQKYIQGLEIIDNRAPDSATDEWFPEAIGLLKQAMDLDPRYALAYWGMGSAYEAYYAEEGDEEALEEAIKYFEKAYELNPGLAEANLALGWTYFYREDLEKAAQSFRRALDISSVSPLVNSDVGVFLVSVGLYQAARKYFDRAIKLSPSYFRAYELSSACYWYIGEYERGVELVKKALELDNSNKSLHLELARHLIMLGKFEEAEEAIQELEKMTPASPEIDYSRALLYAFKQDRNKALGLIRGTEKPYSYPTTCVYALLGMKDEAVENIRLGIKVGFEESQHYLYSYLMLKANPCFEDLRDDPRFKEILEKQREIYYSRMNKARDIL
jgi:tetratricopeptide (TPR) repeat protein